MISLKGFQKKYLKGLAHSLKPVIYIGQRGATDSLVKAVDEALNAHELIKVKFLEIKEKNEKKEIISILEKRATCHFVGLIGHIATIYRPHPKPDQQKIKIPTQ